MLYKSLRLSLLGSLLFTIVILLNACISPNMTSRATGIASSTTTMVQSTTVKTSTVKTSTVCPAPGSGRRAFLPPLSARQDQSVVYLTQNNEDATVHAYDTITGKKKDLFTFSRTTSNIETSISPDGQWITLTSQRVGGEYQIQMVRIDGAYAQTLYCSQGLDVLRGALLSPDQHYLAFNEKNQDTLGDTLKVLDTTTGKIQIELSSQQPGYPTTLAQQSSANQAVAQGIHQGSATQTLKYATKRIPQPSSPPANEYIPVRWVNNQSLYMLAVPTVPSSGSLPTELYQLLDIHKHVDQQSRNVKSITAPLKQDECFSYNITSDNTQLICSTGPTSPIDKTASGISIESIPGGRLHAIFKAPANSQVKAIASFGKTLLFVENNQSGSQLYRIQTDGTHLKLLTSITHSNNPYPIMENLTAEFLPWTTVSFDGKKYALESSDNNGVNSLMIGGMNGGKTTIIATNIFTLSGWTAA